MSRMYLVTCVALALAACGGSAPPPPAQQQPPSAPAQPPPPPPSVSSSPSYLPLPRVPFEPARPMPIVETVFHFAADHPEVLSRMPCFCGCQERGHKNNDDCFVAARDERGRVTAWEPHGIG